MNKALVITAGLLLLMSISASALASGDPAAGETKAGTCVGCHGANGEGVEPNPPLAGLKEAYIAKQLQDFKSGARENAMKKMILQPLSEQDVADLAAYFASK